MGVGVLVSAYAGPAGSAWYSAYTTHLNGGSISDMAIAAGISYASSELGQTANKLGSLARSEYGAFAGSAVRVAGRGITGGTIASLRGGRFERGFGFAAGAAIVNETYQAISKFPGIAPGPGDEPQVKEPGGPNAVFGLNNIGQTARLEADLGKATFEGWLPFRTANYVPFVNAMAGFHDNLASDDYLGFNWLSNVPTMPPSYGIAVAGSLDQIWIGGVNGRNVSVSTIILNQINLK